MDKKENPQRDQHLNSNNTSKNSVCPDSPHTNGNLVDAMDSPSITKLEPSSQPNPHTFILHLPILSSVKPLFAPLTFHLYVQCPSQDSYFSQIDYSNLVSSLEVTMQTALQCPCRYASFPLDPLDINSSFTFTTYEIS